MSMEQDVSEIKLELKEISTTLMRNTVSLEIHEQRTTLAEKRLDAIETFNRWAIGLMFTSTLGVLVRLLFK